LLAKFFTIHDPTTLNRQGPDVGSQYRSAIFYTNDEQKTEALAALEKAKKEAGGRKVVTEVVAAPTFWAAEDYHQDYFKKHGAVCH
jgi:peptide-methionine (S)-S-oxide reductase